MSCKRVNQLNHGIKCKTVVEFLFLPSLNVKSPNTIFFTWLYKLCTQTSNFR